MGTSSEKCTQHQCLPAQLGSSNLLMSASRQVAPSSSDISHRMTFVPPATLLKVSVVSRDLIVTAVIKILSTRVFRAAHVPRKIQRSC